MRLPWNSASKGLKVAKMVARGGGAGVGYTLFSDYCSRQKDSIPDQNGQTLDLFLDHNG